MNSHYCIYNTSAINNLIAIYLLIISTTKTCFKLGIVQKGTTDIVSGLKNKLQKKDFEAFVARRKCKAVGSFPNRPKNFNQIPFQSNI